MRILSLEKLHQPKMILDQFTARHQTVGPLEFAQGLFEKPNMKIDGPENKVSVAIIWRHRNGPLDFPYHFLMRESVCRSPKEAGVSEERGRKSGSSWSALATALSAFAAHSVSSDWKKKLLSE